MTRCMVCDAQVKRAAEKIGDALPGTGGRGFPETKDT